MIRFASLFVVGLFLVLTGCDSDSTLAKDGTYAYTAYNDEDERRASGSLDLEFDDRTLDAAVQINGEWEFTAAGNGETCHWVDEGELLGVADLDLVEAQIDLNPGVTDNNLILNGRFEDGRLTGTWDVITFAGSICSGRFEAVAQ